MEEEAQNLRINNSASLEVQDNVSRFRGAQWFDVVANKSVTIAGCGGIGSWLALMLARTGISGMYLFDPDIVEAVNLSGQLYATKDVGSPKVSVLNSIIYKYCPSGISTYSLRQAITSDVQFMPSSSILFCGFDNMEARKNAFAAWEKLIATDVVPEKCLFVDGRLVAEEFQVFAMTGDDIDARNRYREFYLFSDEEAEATVCSYKQTSHMAAMIGSVMTNIFTNFCANEKNPNLFREVPFLTEYSASNMLFTVKR